MMGNTQGVSKATKPDRKAANRKPPNDSLAADFGSVNETSALGARSVVV